MAPGRILRLGFFQTLLPRAWRTPVLPLTRGNLPPVSQRPPRLTTLPTARIRNPLHIRSFSTSSGVPSTSEEKLSLTQRLRTLIRTHGWYALGVYAALDVIDLVLCFTVIYFLGADQVNRLVQPLRSFVNEILHRQTDPAERTDEAPNSSGSEGLYAIAILAFGIHKLSFPVRVGLTAVFTPRLVSFLTARGWVGKGGATRAAIHVRVRGPDCITWSQLIPLIGKGYGC